MTKRFLGVALLALLAGAPALGAGAPVPVSVGTDTSTLQQLRSARRALVGVLARLEQDMDDLPLAADTLKAAEMDLQVRLAEMDARIAALPVSGPQTKVPAPVRPITGSLDVRFGFDKRPDVQRFISNTVFAAGYPLTDQDTATLVVPLVFQMVRVSYPGTPVRTLTGRGLGDITLLASHRMATRIPGVSLSLTGGLILPTGSDPFHVSPGELPTGEGFLQPQFRVTLEKLRIPLQMYGTFEYGTALRRRVAGRSFKLPDSYGGEAGFYYLAGPDYTVQTALSLRQVNSPVLRGPGVTEGYLTEALVYQAGGTSTVRAAADVGLTEDSIHLYLGLAYRRGF